MATDYNEKFSNEIDQFERYGTYSYKFDEAGNFSLNSESDNFSRVFIALGLNNILYNTSKIESFYNPRFVEFPPVIQSSSSIDINVNSTSNADQAKISELESQLNSVIQENERLSDVEANKEAVKQVILELRKELNQGQVDSDFSETFPYTPIRKESTNI